MSRYEFTVIAVAVGIVYVVIATHVPEICDKLAHVLNAAMK